MQVLVNIKLFEVAECTFCCNYHHCEWNTSNDTMSFYLVYFIGLYKLYFYLLLVYRFVSLCKYHSLSVCQRMLKYENCLQNYDKYRKDTTVPSRTSRQPHNSLGLIQPFRNWTDNNKLQYLLHVSPGNSVAV